MRAGRISIENNINGGSGSEAQGQENANSKWDQMSELITFIVCKLDVRRRLSRQRAPQFPAQPTTTASRDCSII